MKYSKVINFIADSLAYTLLFICIWAVFAIVLHVLFYPFITEVTIATEIAKWMFIPVLFIVYKIYNKYEKV